MVRKAALVGFLPLFLIAATPPEPRFVTETLPPVGASVEVSAGEPIAESAPIIILSGAVLLADAVAPANLADLPRIPVGSPLYEIDTSKAFKACEIHTPATYPACLIDDDGDGDFDRMSRNDVTKAHPLPIAVPYRRELEVRRAGARGLKRTLLYQGGTAESIRLSYREFSDGLARDAFTEDLVIPLSGPLPQRFSVKGMSFTVQSIGSGGMQFRLDTVKRDSGWGNPAPADAIR